MAHLLKIDSGIIGLHRNLMICDRIYIELIGENRKDVIDGMFTKEQRGFMNLMNSFPSIIRTEYAYALLYEKNRDKAEKYEKLFEKCAKIYPYPSDIQSERKLMEIAKLKNEAMQYNNGWQA